MADHPHPDSNLASGLAARDPMAVQLYLRDLRRARIDATLSALLRLARRLVVGPRSTRPARRRTAQ